MIRVLIAEDQAMVRGALAALLEIEEDIAIVAQAADGQEALDRIREIRPDIVVADIEMPRMTGLDLAREVTRQSLPTRVIILTTFARPGYLKDTPAERLAEAVRRVDGGGRVIDPELASDAWSDPDPLTDRERQVLRLADEGRTTAAIGEYLGLAEGTVRNYLSEAISKMGARNRIEAARTAREKGWL